ncbi:MAG TPA: SusD/RagB family nutrient-binding outer membrane lipoprotein [Chitinophagaceae bacterium]|nr:SusD/RagB family nutrient-binding outer membrane lipoprotein [Chitinophagaceae bacterium]
MLFKSRSIKLLLLCTVVFTSCKKYLDINKDPNNPLTIEVSKLLPTAENSLGNSLAIGNGTTGGLSQILEVYTHQLSTRESQDQYNYTGSGFYIGTAWPTMYQGVFENLEQIIKIGGAAGDRQYVGIAKILKAYGYSQFVDAFGDIPFSEANRLDSSIRYPKFDDDATIYPKLIALLDEGIADVSNTTAPNVHRPTSDDVIYGGNVQRWVKAANTIKLKLYVQVRRVQNVQTQVNALLASPNTLINATNESFWLPYGPNAATDDRNPGFGDYIATQRSNHVSPWFYETLKGYRPDIFNNNPDPRLPYYIFNQIKPTTITADATEYRDGGFVSIYFGSRGPNRDRNQQNVISLMGIYPVGGRYDDGQGGTAGAGSGTGAAPYKFITYADRLYLQAELINAGLVTGDARAVLQAAMNESFKQVDYVITNLIHPTQSVPAVNGTAAMTTYINKVLTEYDAGDAAKKLRIIITEKWLASYGSAVDQYSDYRRTGYPILFNPNDPTMAPGGFVQPPINGNPQVNPQPAVLVQLSRPYPNSLPWFQTELETNPNAPPQKDLVNSFKVFWMP